LQAIGNDPEPGEIAELFFGINEQIVQAALTQFGGDLKDFWTALKDYCRKLTDPDQSLYLDAATGLVFMSPDEDRERFDSIYQLLQYLSRQKPTTAKKKDSASELRARLKRVLKREHKKAQKLEEAVKKAEEYPALQREAELLSINLHLIKEGSESVQVMDIYNEDDSEIEISLDPALSPGKNVEHKFERAKRLRENIPRLKRQLNQSRANLERLEQAKTEFDKVTDGKVPDELRAELDELGVPAAGGRKKKSDDKPERLPYRQYKSSLGEDIWVGKSARDNDQLTFKHARKYDLWLHSQQTAGSHVILRRPNKSHQFQKRSIVEAAEAAAFFSAAKNADTVPVIYTEVRYVRKTRKGPPGQVIADRTRSILVEPRRPKN